MIVLDAQQNDDRWRVRVAVDDGLCGGLDLPATAWEAVLHLLTAGAGNLSDDVRVTMPNVQIRREFGIPRGWGVPQ